MLKRMNRVLCAVAVALVSRETNKPSAAAEVHDASDDVYYVVEGAARLTLGGALEAPRETEPGEWRGSRRS